MYSPVRILLSNSRSCLIAPIYVAMQDGLTRWQYHHQEQRRRGGKFLVPFKLILSAIVTVAALMKFLAEENYTTLEM